MKVRQLVGFYAGHVIEMDFAEAQACLACGTVELTDDTGTRENAVSGAVSRPITGFTTSDLPANWEKQSAAKVKSYAQRLTGKEFKSKRSAVEAIRALG